MFELYFVSKTNGQFTAALVYRETVRRIHTYLTHLTRAPTLFNNYLNIIEKVLRLKSFKYNSHKATNYYNFLVRAFYTSINNKC